MYLAILGEGLLRTILSALHYASTIYFYLLLRVTIENLSKLKASKVLNFLVQRSEISKLLKSVGRPHAILKQSLDFAGHSQYNHFRANLRLRRPVQ